MFFNAEEDEGDFLSPSSGSKLGALFGIDQASSQGGNESLKYSAPKQPKKKTEAPSGGSAPGVLNATAVQAYKYVDGQFANQGKLGAAILGNPSNQDYKILLYVSKQQQVTNAKIYSGFSFTVQPNHYASFYDDARQSWSIMFTNEAAAVAFTKHVCLAKALCSGPGVEVVSQDLTLGEGGPLESGDSAEVKYTGWLLTNNTFGKVFDTNTNAEKLFRFKLGKGKVIKGWDIGVVGMKKNSKRLLVVPPNFAYGEQGMGDRVPSNSTLIFEIEVVRVKLSKADSPTESPAPTPPTVDDVDETTVKGRSRSITEQMSQSPASDKAKLISRMAKMGQPMLPMSGAVAASPEDEDDHTQYYQHEQNMQPQQQPVAQPLATQPQMVQPTAMPVGQPIAQPQYQPQYQPQIQPTVNHMAAQPVMQQQQPPAFVQNLPSQQLQQQQLSLYQPIQPQIQQQPFQQMPPNPGQYGVQPPQPHQPYASNIYPTSSYPGTGQDMNTPLLMSEARQQNTEVRISVGKVADKVDKILEKLEHMQVHGTAGSLALPGGNTPPMENGVLLHNIQKVIQENERLKKELFEKSARIESQNEKIGDLLQRNQRYVEQSNLLLEQRNDTFKNTAANSQARVLTLEQEKVQIATELSVSTAQISSLQLELSALRKKEGDLKHQLSAVLEDTGKNKDEINRLRISHSDEERKASELTELLKDEKLSRKQLENQVSQLKEEMADVKMTNETLDKNLSERKKKSGDERRRLEEELEEVKSQYEEEIQSLKNKLRKQKSSTDAATAEQVAQLEREITEEWQEKTEKMLKAAEDKHKRALKEVEEEKSQAQQSAKELEKKVQGLKTSGNDSDQKVTVLQSRVEELEIWKDKYDNLRSQAGLMKERYEERITELEGRLRETSPTETSPGTPQDVAGEVKKIMNSVYQNLRGEIKPEKSYKGEEALTIILDTIKKETLKMVKGEGAQSKAEESEEESEEDDDDEEDSEEEAEEEPVVVETLSAQKASSSQGAAPSKETSSGKYVPKEERTMASIEDQVLSQLIGSGGVSADSTSTSAKKEKEPGKGEEELIKPSVDKITGDKGNKYYSEELDKSKGKSDITKTEEPTVKSAAGTAEIKEVIEEPIKSSKDSITGDKGNKYYSAELDKGKGPEGDKSGEEEEGKEKSDDESDASESTESESESYEDVHIGSEGVLETVEETPEETEDTETTKTGENETETMKAQDDEPKDEEQVKSITDVVIAEQNADSSKDGFDTFTQTTHTSSIDSTIPGTGSDFAAAAEDIVGSPEHLDNASPPYIRVSDIADNESENKETEGPGPDYTSPENSATEKPPVDNEKDVDESGEAPASENPLGEETSGKLPGEEALEKSPAEETLEKSPAEEAVEKSPAEETLEKSPSEETAEKSPEEEASQKSPAEEPSEKTPSEEASEKPPTPVEEATEDNSAVTDAEDKDGTQDKENPPRKMNEEVTIKGEADEESQTSEEDQNDSDANNKTKTENALVEQAVDKTASDKSKKDTPDGDKKAGGDDGGFTSAEIEAMLFGATGSTTGHTSSSKADTEKPDTKVFEPIVSSSATSLSMGRQPVQSEVIEPMIASSTTAANLGAKPKGDKSDKKPVKEKKLKKSSDKPTGDKGNRYHTETLDKSGAGVIDPLFSKSTARVTGDKGSPYHTEKLDKSKPDKEQPKAVVETMTASSTGGGLSATPTKPTPVEEPMMMAKSSAVSMAAKPVVVPKFTKSKDHPTGDKGNVYHSAKLDQSSKPKAGSAKVEPLIPKSADHPTGNKGNPHHTAHLDQSGKGVPVEAVESKIVSSSGGKVMGGNPYHSSNLDKSTGSTGGKGMPVVEPMVASSVSAPTMAASPSHMKKDNKKEKKDGVDGGFISRPESTPVSPKLHLPQVYFDLETTGFAVAVEPMISKKSDHVTGGRGNPYHTGKLDESASGKSPKAVPVVAPQFAKSSSHVTGDKGNPYHSAKLDRKKDSPVVPPAASREPPPLDSSLFGDDNTVMDTFGTDFKPTEESKEEAKKTDTKKDDKKSADKKLPSKTELLSDDSLKEKPPPLFGDDDDDDLDWLSK